MPEKTFFTANIELAHLSKSPDLHFTLITGYGRRLTLYESNLSRLSEQSDDSEEDSDLAGFLLPR